MKASMHPISAQKWNLSHPALTLTASAIHDTVLSRQVIQYHKGPSLVGNDRTQVVVNLKPIGALENSLIRQIQLSWGSYI